MHIVKMEALGPCVSSYLEIFEAQGQIAFEMTEQGYLDLSSFTKWYKKKRDAGESLSDDWEDELKNLESSADSDAVFVFGFLTQVWNSNTQISVEKFNENLLLAIRKKVEH